MQNKLVVAFMGGCLSSLALAVKKHLGISRQPTLKNVRQFLVLLVVRSSI